MNAIKIKVHPRASCNKVIKIENNFFNVYVTSPPEKSKANEAVIELLSDFLKIPKTNFVIKSGKKSRIKIVNIKQ